MLRLHQAGVGVYLHRFRHFPHFQCYVDLDVVADSQKNAGLHVRVKPGNHRLQRVGADRQTGDSVDAIRVGDCIVNRAGIHSGHPDLGAAHQRTLLVRNATGHCRNGDCLRLERRSVSQRHGGQQQTTSSNNTS